MPKALHVKAKSDLHQIWLAESREMATKAFDHFFLEKYGPEYEAACSCLWRDRNLLLRFHDFLPAEHWGHLRTTDSIESTFSTICLRHRWTKGSGSRKASLSMMFKLVESAGRCWRRLNRHHQMFLFSKEEFPPTESCRTPPDSDPPNTTLDNSFPQP
jgi:putative transposase